VVIEFGTCLAPWLLAFEKLQRSCQQFFIEGATEPREIIQRVSPHSVVKDSTDKSTTIDYAVESIQLGSTCLFIFDVTSDDHTFLVACVSLLKQFDLRLGRVTPAIFRTWPFAKHARMGFAKLVWGPPSLHKGIRLRPCK
jgi:hypothetical protein